MTLGEAKGIAEIIGTADSGCSDCVGDLVARMNEKFPEFVWETGAFATRAMEDGCQENYIAVSVVPREGSKA